MGEKDVSRYTGLALREPREVPQRRGTGPRHPGFAPEGDEGGRGPWVALAGGVGSRGYPGEQRAVSAQLASIVTVGWLLGPFGHCSSRRTEAALFE